MVIIIRFVLVALVIFLVVSLSQIVLQWSKNHRNWQELLRICHGDYEQANRLIQYEKKANFSLNKYEACRKAINRYYRDNR